MLSEMSHNTSETEMTIFMNAINRLLGESGKHYEAYL